MYIINYIYLASLIIIMEPNHFQWYILPLLTKKGLNVTPTSGTILGPHLKKDDTIQYLSGLNLRYTLNN